MYRIDALEDMLPPLESRGYPVLKERKRTWKTLSRREREIEMIACALDREYFIRKYVSIYDSATRAWIPFELWAAQLLIIDLYERHKKGAVGKSRQVGATWVFLALALHHMIFEPIAEVGIWCKGEREAAKLLGKERLKGMYYALPEWMQCESVEVDKYTEFRLSNGSGATAFPSSAGDSYTATLAIIDEADLIEDLRELMLRVEPTIQVGGKLFLVSKFEKDNQDSQFKKIFVAGLEGKNDYGALFLPWYSNPHRTRQWYKALKAAALETNGHLDDVHENYPATLAEALTPRTVNTRFAPRWMQRAYDDMPPLVVIGHEVNRESLPFDVPAIPDLVIYERPRGGRTYTIGIDAAEGKEESHDTSLSVIENETLTEVAHLSGLIEPTTTAEIAHLLGVYYNNADIIPERNNHGHTIVAHLIAHSHLRVLNGLDGDPGWLSNGRGKFVAYNEAAKVLSKGLATIRHLKTFNQLSSILRSTLKAPKGKPDDAADSWVIAIAGSQLGAIQTGEGFVLSV